MAPHHMLDIVDPLYLNFTVKQFRDMALPIIDDLLARKKLPIIVGGTNYYIESILWKILIDGPAIVPSSDNLCTKETTDGSNKRSDRRIDEEQEISSSKKMKLDRSMTENTEELYKKLVEVDPEMAKRLHPNNARKIIRSLEVFELYGVRHSELLTVQRRAGGSGLGGPLRHTNSIILWLRCDQSVLDERLECRVDAMLETGLVQELLNFHRRYNEQRIESNTSTDYTKGIFQTIGFKEFHAYLVLPEEEKREKKGQELLQRGIEDLKLVTKRYAKKQQKWIMNRLIRRTDRPMPPVYSLNCTNLNQWNSCVHDPAMAIIDATLRGEEPVQKPMNQSAIDYIKVTDSSNEETHYCDDCQRIFVGEFQWNIHLQSKKHSTVLKRKRRLEKETKMQETAPITS
ncbi:tRNA dimethylallyltransferase isoform X2 [Ptiloglossa arizonensis]